MASVWHYRLVLLPLVLLCIAFLGVAYVQAGAEDPFARFEAEMDRPAEEREPLAPPRDGVTVFTAHMKEAGDIVAIGPDGTVLYHNDSHDGYWDVDPSPEGEYTVVYVATDEVHDRSRCRPVGGTACIRQMIEQVNLTTGEVTVLYSRIDPRYENSEWHDVDRINDTHYLVADMHDDRVFIVNVTSGIVTWQWSAQQALPLESGGPYPDDWVHLNDVEALEDGRILVSLRNQDRVVFVDRRTGVVDEWTLGAEDDHDVLYEQHNPDYIPPSHGGPALLVADSENNRVVEYQRTRSGEWRQSWTWRDRRLKWPRDADRLPNGHTLITDTNGERIIEVDREGAVVWTLDVPIAYEAERLSTGDESAGGPSASQADLVSHREGHDTSGGLLTVDDKLLNAMENGTPVWMDLTELAVLLLGALSLLVWLGIEAKGSRYTFRSPIVRRAGR